MWSVVSKNGTTNYGKFNKTVWNQINQFHGSYWIISTLNLLGLWLPIEKTFWRICSTCQSFDPSTYVLNRHLPKKKFECWSMEISSNVVFGLKSQPIIKSSSHRNHSVWIFVIGNTGTLDHFWICHLPHNFTTEPNCQRTMGSCLVFWMGNFTNFLGFFWEKYNKTHKCFFWLCYRWFHCLGMKSCTSTTTFKYFLKASKAMEKKWLKSKTVITMLYKMLVICTEKGGNFSDPHFENLSYFVQISLDYWVQRHFLYSWDFVLHVMR